MNPKIKEALSTEFQKDEETERICTFIADFIKDYGYLLSHGNTVRINCTFLYPGRITHTDRIKYNTIMLWHPEDRTISRRIITKFNKEIVHNLLKKENAHFISTHYNYACTETWQLEFNRT